MNTAVAMANRIPLLPTQDWPHSGSLTEPLIASPERLHQARSSVDGSPCHPAVEHDNSDSLSSPSRRPRKKRRSTSSSSIPSAKDQSRKDSVLLKSPSVPTFHTKTDTRDSDPAIPAPEQPLPTTSATPLLGVPSNASTVDTRSPSHKRAPASHSSYGVETSNGPPPSFTTQRTLSQDRLWKPTPPEKPNAPKKMNAGPSAEESGLSHLSMGEALDNLEGDLNRDDLEISRTPRKKVDGSINDQNLDPGSAMAGDSTETLRTGGKLLTRASDIPSADEESKNSGSDDRKSEDMFLKIAQAEVGGQELMTRAERRKTRIGSFYASSISKPSSGHRSEAKSPEEHDHVNDERLSLRTEVPYHSHKRHSFGPRSAGASAHPLDDLGRHKYFGSGARTHANSTQSTIGRPDHETSPELLHESSNSATNLDLSARSYRRSNLSAFRADRMASTPEAQERSRPVDHNRTRVEGTESTMSTTAPSTVWDELDELKSRIRKLELTGKLPSSSAAAMSSAERPRTATTTVTTMSSSPKRNASTSPVESAIDGISSTVHPLLHEALRNARPVLSADVYQKLESTASDALQLASMTAVGLQSGNASAAGISSSTERQLRRRADGTCRGLTELAIALSARPRSPTLSQPLRPSSRDTSSNFHTPPTTSYSVDSGARFTRRFSNDPDETRQALTSRAQSRLETHRASLLHNNIINSPHEHTSTEVAVHTPSSAHSPNQMQSFSSSRLNRAATRLRGRRSSGQADGAEESENEPSPSVRPVSRARTEVGLRHRSARDRTSWGREYTSSHPLPSFVRKGDSPATQGSPSVIPSSGLSTRRPYASSNVNGGSSNLNSPTTPSHNIQPGYQRYVSNGARRDSSAYLSSTEHTPENVTVRRGNASGSRRSLGLTSRLGQMGSFVNGRLRAVKAERERQEALQGQQKALVLRVTSQESGSGQENQVVS